VSRRDLDVPPSLAPQLLPSLALPRAHVTRGERDLRINSSRATLEDEMCCARWQRQPRTWLDATDRLALAAFP